MEKRTAIYTRLNSDYPGTQGELCSSLQAVIEARGDLLAGIYTDDSSITGRGRYAGWRRLLTDLDGIQQIVLVDVAHLPAKTVADLLALLTKLAEHGVTVAVPSLEIDTSTGPAAILDLIRAFRRARWSAAIRVGQEKSNKRIGRPPVPPAIRNRIVAALDAGGGVRPTAKRFKVSPALVIAIRHEMQAMTERQAA